MEPWFVGARVATAVTIARRCEDAGRRDANTVRFVELRKPLAELLEGDGSTLGAMLAADLFRDELLGVTTDVSHKRYRARLINQGKLWRAGGELGVMMRGESANIDDEESGADTADEKIPTAASEYFGGKWGVYLRAPDLWFDLIDRFGDRFTSLGELAEIRFGVKSGKDDFFYPKDTTDECLAALSDPSGLGKRT